MATKLTNFYVALLLTNLINPSCTLYKTTTTLPSTPPIGLYIITNTFHI